eukprot:TRINITY_DN27086_c0_g1_i1.p1 TRINITY_DN27086_c0_g1~~TRINITY_DN27086_c0_g1_i1.p1  ORF type:complete len:657 (+),score=105.77 TRINITY_DN27086_c0_g1_i1:76-2046(+)
MAGQLGRSCAMSARTTPGRVSRGSWRQPQRRSVEMYSASSSSRRLASATTAGAFGKLMDSCQNSWLADLHHDPEGVGQTPNRTARQVHSGHYVLTEPTPLPEPYLVAHTPGLAAELGLTSEVCRSEEFARVFSGDVSCVDGLQAWATPYALSIYGHEMTNNCPFGDGKGYGDGRAHSIGEFVAATGNRWELQLKGAGPTPFCRGADGRAVLRSSVREFLVSEAMHNLGVPTTRALSLVASRTAGVTRPWYSASTLDGMDLDSSLRRLLKKNFKKDFDAMSEEMKQGYREQLRRELEQQGSSQNPDMLIEEPCAITCRAAPSFLRVGHLELFSRRVRADPEDVAARTELEMLLEHCLKREYSEVDPAQPLQLRALAMLRLARQRLARLAAEWVRVGYVQGNFNSDNCLVGGRTMDYGPFGFVERYQPLWNMWVGGSEKYGFLNQPNAALQNFHSLVSAVTPLLDDRHKEEAADIAEGFGDVAREALWEVWRRKLGLVAPSGASQRLFSELEPILRSSNVDWTIFWRSLAHVAASNTAEASPQELLQHLQASFYEDLPGATEQQWAAWLQDWLSALRAEGREAALISADMNLASPKYVPREWMLVAAYEATQRGDMAPLEELQRLFAEPYGEQPEFHERFFRRQPLEVHGKGGVAWMS